MAVRGGVAERHLEKALEHDPEVEEVALDTPRGPRLHRRLHQVGRAEVTVECKNASPKTYAGGTPKVETQKTRASKGDPNSRLYEPSQFDVLAACMYGPWRRWEFRYKARPPFARDASTSIGSLRYSGSTNLVRPFAWSMR